MRFGIYTNTNKDAECAFTKLVVDELLAIKQEVFVHPVIRNFFPDSGVVNSSFKGIDMMIAIGGDGTILRIAKKCAIKNIPIFGFNFGNVGFLTDGNAKDYRNILKELTLGNYKVEKRCMLAAKAGVKEYLALNDFVVAREHNKLILLDVFVDENFVDRYYCDGFIVSTPTGSTAYSLSAGGAIISPTANAIALTPINSHSLHSRPIVVGANEVVKIALAGSSGPAKIIADGGAVAKLGTTQAVKICTSSNMAKFVRLNDYNFYEKLLLKLNKWSTSVNTEEKSNASNGKTE